MFNITPIAQAVIALLAAVITAVVVPYIKSKTTASQQSQINALVQIAVAAAEQTCRGSGKGKEKKAYVVKWLHDHNITVDESQLDAMIEAAVYDLKSGVIPAEPIKLSPGVLITEGSNGD